MASLPRPGMPDISTLLTTHVRIIFNGTLATSINSINISPRSIDFNYRLHICEMFIRSSLLRSQPETEEEEKNAFNLFSCDVHGLFDFPFRYPPSFLSAAIESSAWKIRALHAPTAFLMRFHIFAITSSQISNWIFETIIFPTFECRGCSPTTRV